MSKLLRITLGIFTSIGGVLEVGAIATTAQAGSVFGFQLLWAVLLGTICVIFLVEMSGRLAAVSHHTIKDALREHPRIERWVVRMTRRWGPQHLAPVRIPWSRVKKIGVDVKVDMDAAPMMRWEHWVRDHIIGRIPGA